MEFVMLDVLLNMLHCLAAPMTGTQTALNLFQRKPREFFVEGSSLLGRQRHSLSFSLQSNQPRRLLA